MLSYGRSIGRDRHTGEQVQHDRMLLPGATGRCDKNPPICAFLRGGAGIVFVAIAVARAEEYHIIRIPMAPNGTRRVAKLLWLPFPGLA